MACSPSDKFTRITAWLAPLTVVLVPIVFLFPVVFLGEVFFLKDTGGWFYPSRLFWRERVLSGDLPLWLHHLNLGMPFLADPGNSTLYPPNLLLLLPAPACVGYFLAAHLVLAALGAYILLRTLKVSRCASMFGSFSYGLGGYVLSMLSIAGYLPAICWMPLVAGLGLRSIRSRNLRELALFGLALGCQMLSGEIQGVFLTAMLLGALLLAEETNRPWSLIRLALGSLIGLAIFMPQALTTIGYIAQTWRAHGVDMEVATAWSLHPLRLLELIVPGLLGNANRYDSYLGYFLYDGAEGLPMPWILSPYIGSLCIVFAVAAIGGLKNKHKRWAIAIVSVSVIALLLSFGRYTPLFALYRETVPGAGFLRYPVKFFPLVSLGMSLLGAVGLDSCLDDKKNADRSAVIAIAAGAVISALALVASLFAGRIGKALADVSFWVKVDEETAVSIVRSALRLEAGITIALMLSLILVGQKKKAWLGKAALVALLIQLVVMNRDIAPTTSPYLYETTPAIARKIIDDTPQGEPPRIYIPMTGEPPFFGCLESFDVEQIFLWSKLTLMFNDGIMHGIGYPTAYSPISSYSNVRFFSSTIGVRQQVNNLLSVRHLIVPRDLKIPPNIGLNVLPGFEDACIGVYRSDRALPVARPVDRVIPASELEEALALVQRSDVLLGKSAVVEGIGAEQEGGSNGSSPGYCRSERPTGDSFETTCELTRPSWVVVNISHYDNWTARIDGASAPIHRSNGIVMAVHMPVGRHHMELIYNEPWLPIGGVFTLLGLAACACLIFCQRRKKK
jgi:hypothetical protein